MYSLKYHFKQYYNSKKILNHFTCDTLFSTNQAIFIFSELSSNSIPSYNILSRFIYKPCFCKVSVYTISHNSISPIIIYAICCCVSVFLESPVFIWEKIDSNMVHISLCSWSRDLWDEREDSIDTILFMSLASYYCCMFSLHYKWCG